VALLFSYGAAAFLATGAGVAMALGLERFDWRCLAARSTTLVTSFLSGCAVLAIPAVLGFSYIENFVAVSALHYERYTAPRSYWTWLVFNPLDLALFLGIPVAFLLCLRWGSALTGLAAGRAWPRHDLARVAIVTALGLTVLLLSGAVRGEVGRLLVPLMPLLLVVALLRRDGMRVRGPGATEAGRLALLLLASDVVLRLAWRLP
jgi:hypothetical protein